MHAKGFLCPKKGIRTIKQGENCMKKIVPKLDYFCSGIGLIFCLALLAFLYSIDSHATNHLASLKSDITDTFGANSDVPYFLLLAEGVVGADRRTPPRAAVGLGCRDASPK